MSIDLERWQRKADYYANGPEWVHRIWSTQPSFDWFCKSRRQALSQAGVLRKLGRDWFVNSELLEAVVRSELGEAA